MPPDPPIRASDQDRERTAHQLREHHAVGRLDAEEFNERLDKVFEAKTIADLDDLTADLPAVDLYPLPTASLPRSRRVSSDLPAASVLRHIGVRAGEGRFSAGWPAAWGSWLTVTLICALLLLVTGNPWPLLVAGAAGAVLGGRWIAGSLRSGHGDGRGQIGQHHEEIGGPDDAA
jgi:hypothetical protein